MTDSKLQEKSNPAAVAWHWTSTYDDFPAVEHSITWVRGTYSLRYGTKMEGRAWTDTELVNPERFGFDGSLKSARTAAKAFLAA